MSLNSTARAYLPSIRDMVKQLDQIRTDLTTAVTEADNVTDQSGITLAELYHNALHAPRLPVQRIHNEAAHIALREAFADLELARAKLIEFHASLDSAVHPYGPLPRY